MPSDLRPALRPRGDPVVIELVGTPGAGKTTLGRLLVARLRADGVVATTMVEAGRLRTGRTAAGAWVRLLPSSWRSPVLWQCHLAASRWHTLGFVRQHRRLVRHVLVGQRGRPLPPRLRGHILRWWFAQAGRRRFLAATARPGDVLVVDDGFLHRAATLHASPDEVPAPHRVRAYVDLVPRPDLVIVVRADPATCRERVGARGAWRHRPLDDQELTAFLTHAARAVDLAVGQARADHWTVLEIDNTPPDVDATADELAAAVRAWLATGVLPVTRPAVAEVGA